MRRSCFPDHIAVGSDVRIDAFCLLVGTAEGIHIGDHVHLSAYSSILGRRATVIEDFSTISVRCSIFTSSDDYSGDATLTEPDRARRAAWCTRPTPRSRIPAHSAIGAGAVVLPGVSVGPSAAVGAS